MNGVNDHLDPLDADLMLLAVGELDDAATEQLRAKLANDPDLRQRYAGLTEDLAWLDEAVSEADTGARPVRTTAALRGVREQLLTQPAVERPERQPWKRPLAGVPNWVLSSAAAAAVVIGGFLYWGLRDTPTEIGPSIANNFGNGDITLPDEHVTTLQRQVEWAFGVDELIGDGLADTVDDTAGLEYAAGSVDELYYDLDSFDDFGYDAFAPILEVY
ncbi:MAG: hypothetical protein AAGD32_00045 [Planctomycetota bacterium]